MSWRYEQRRCRKRRSGFIVGCCQSSGDHRPNTNMPVCRLKSTARPWGWKSLSALWPTICSLMAGSSQGIKRYGALPLDLCRFSKSKSLDLPVWIYDKGHQSCSERLLWYLSVQALDFLQQNSRRLQFMRTKPLPVSGAFHTELMESATEPLREVLRQVEVSQVHMMRRLLCMSKDAMNLF